MGRIAQASIIIGYASRVVKMISPSLHMVLIAVPTTLVVHSTPDWHGAVNEILNAGHGVAVSPRGRDWRSASCRSHIHSRPGIRQQLTLAAMRLRGLLLRLGDFPPLLRGVASGFPGSMKIALIDQRQHFLNGKHSLPRLLPQSAGRVQV